MKTILELSKFNHVKYYNMYKVVIALMFGVCCLYAIDNPTPQHVMPKPMTWETYITLNMLTYERGKIEEKMMMNMTTNNPATND